MKVVKAADGLTDHILGIIPKAWNELEIKAYLNQLSLYYGFECAVFEEDMRCHSCNHK